VPKYVLGSLQGLVELSGLPCVELEPHQEVVAFPVILDRIGQPPDTPALTHRHRSAPVGYVPGDAVDRHGGLSLARLRGQDDH
jgi:hypothetical protein